MNQKLLIWSVGVAVLAVCLVFTAMRFLRPSPNLVRNGDFEHGLDNWWWYVRPNTDAQARFATENVAGANGLALRVSVDRAVSFDDIEISQGSLPTKAGHKYTASFRARSSVPQGIEIKLIKNADPWTLYGLVRTVSVSTKWQRFKVTGRATATAEDGKLMFHFDTPDAIIWIDDVKFLERGGG